MPRLIEPAWASPFHVEIEGKMRVNYLANYKPVEEVPDSSNVLLSRWRCTLTRQLLHIGRDVHGLHCGDGRHACDFAPRQKTPAWPGRLRAECAGCECLAVKNSKNRRCAWSPAFSIKIEGETVSGDKFVHARRLTWQRIWKKR